MGVECVAFCRQVHAAASATSHVFTRQVFDPANIAATFPMNIGDLCNFTTVSEYAVKCLCSARRFPRKLSLQVWRTPSLTGGHTSYSCTPSRNVRRVRRGTHFCFCCFPSHVKISLNASRSHGSVRASVFQKLIHEGNQRSAGRRTLDDPPLPQGGEGARSLTCPNRLRHLSPSL